MEFSIELHTIKSGWSIVYIEGSLVMISKQYCISFSEDQISGSSLSAKVLVMGFLIHKGLNTVVI